MFKLVLGTVIVPIVLVVCVALVGSGDDPAPAANGAVNTAAASEIPSPFLSAYQQAVTSCGGLDWRVLAGIGWVESGHGRGRTVGPEGDVLPPIVGPAIDGRAGFARIPDSGSSDGWAHARGPMQFLTTTWRGVARLGPGRPPGASPSIDNIFDAAATAAAYLCGTSGSLGDVRAAILRYNHSDRYVDQVLAKAAEYGMGQTTQPAILLAGMACPVGGPMSHFRDWHASRSGGREHQGNDLMGALGIPLVAIESGIIDRASDTDVGLGGITIWVRGDSGTRYYYAHNLRNVARVGQRVIAGEVIAYLGKTGNARTTAPHVHFEVHPGGGPASDPYELIAKICSKA